MCLNLGDLDGVPIYCRKCWKCQKRRKLNYVGRALAEAYTSKECVVATYTYGTDPHYYAPELAKHPHAFKIVYDDVRKAIMMMRKYSDGPMRFFVVAELGALKGRAHWHCIFFWPDGGMPRNIELDKRYIHQTQTDAQAEAEGARFKRGKYKTLKTPWPHGYVFFQEPHENSFAYVLKYILKDIEDVTIISDEREADDDAEFIFDELDAELAGLVFHGGSKDKDRPKKMGLSCMPPLGSQYLEGRAREIAEGGFALHDLSYTVPNCVDHKTDRLKKFWLQDRSAERYVFAYFRRWREVHGNERWPPTELAKKYAARFDEYEIGQLRKERPAIDPSREEVDKIWQLQLQDKPGKFFPLLGTRGIHADSAWKPPDANAYRRAAKGWEPLHIGGLVSPVLYGPRRTTAADTAAANADRLMVRSFLEEFRRHHRFDDDAAATPISKANNPNPTRAIQP